LAQFLLRALHFRLHVSLVLVGALKLFAKLRLRAIEFLGRNRHLASLRFLVHQFFEDDHFQCALADCGFLFLRKSVVLLGVGEDGVHLA
jgi:hypothetical protein